MPRAKPVIATRGLTKHYGRVRGIENLDLQVNAGEVFGFLGPNGAGKSTTINLLMGFRRASSGQARVFGHDPFTQAPQVHRRLGFTPGELSLYEHLTSRQLFEYLGRLRGQIDWDYTRQLTERFRLDPTRKIKTLSKGNKQKVGLIQAWLHRPDLLILDEPTSGLDPLMQHEFAELVREARAEGRTVFLSSHVMAEVEQICDRAAIIRDGRLVSIEEISELHRRSLRHLEVQFVTRVPKDVLRGIPGVRDIHVDQHTLRATVAGSMDAVLKRLTKHRIKNLTSEHASLEELFFELYGEDVDA